MTSARWLPQVLALIALALAASCTAGDSSAERAPTEAGRVPEATLPPARITAALLRAETYDAAGGSDTASRRQVAVEDGLRVTDKAVRSGSYAGEAVLGPSDPQYRDRLGYRAEWQSDFHAEQDVEYWYGASYYLPDDWNQGDNPDAFDDRIVFQFHEGTGGSPVFSLHLVEDSSRFVLRRRQADESFHYLWSDAFETERWYDFAFQVRWTPGEDGLFRVYLDGHPVLDYQGPTLVDGTTAYTKWGVYGQPTRVLFDEIRIARGADALPLVSPPSFIRRP